MLSLLKNNFVISALVSLAVLVYVFLQNRKKEHESYGMLFYLRLFALCFILVLVVLYFKTGDLSVPSMGSSMQSGGSLGGSLGETKVLSSMSSLSPTVSPPSYNNAVDHGADLRLQKVNLGHTPF